MKYIFLLIIFILPKIINAQKQHYYGLNDSLYLKSYGFPCPSVLKSNKVKKIVTGNNKVFYFNEQGLLIKSKGRSSPIIYEWVKYDSLNRPISWKIRNGEKSTASYSNDSLKFRIKEGRFVDYFSYYKSNTLDSTVIIRTLFNETISVVQKSTDSGFVYYAYSLEHFINDNKDSFTVDVKNVLFDTIFSYCHFNVDSTEKHCYIPFNAYFNKDNYFAILSFRDNNHKLIQHFKNGKLQYEEYINDYIEHLNGKNFSSKARFEIDQYFYDSFGRIVMRKKNEPRSHVPETQLVYEIIYTDNSVLPAEISYYKYDSDLKKVKQDYTLKFRYEFYE